MVADQIDRRRESRIEGRVEVVIPCYNYGRYLPACVDSVISQHGIDLRVLIIDDASQDNTAEVGVELARRDHRITFLRHRANQGHISTYNEGIDWTSGDYWLLLSADDLLAAGALARAMSVLNQNPRIGLAYGRAAVLRANAAPPVLVPPNTEGWRHLSGRQFLEHVCRTVANPVPTPTAVVRTALQKAIGGYRPELPHSGDMEMWMRIAVHADVAFLTACQGIYRWHGDNMQRQFLRAGLGDLPERRRAFDVLFANYSSRLVDAKQLERTVRRRIAEAAFWTGSRAFDQGDIESFRACTDFAITCLPEIRSWSAWRHLRYKALIGQRIWRWIRPLCDMIRNKPPSDSDYDDPLPGMSAWTLESEVVSKEAPRGRYALT